MNLNCLNVWVFKFDFQNTSKYWIYSKHSATDINLLWWIQLASESGTQ